MRKLSIMLLSVSLAGCLMGATHLKVGDKAPGFTLTASNREQVSLSDFAGKNTVVLGFFPAAFTGG